MGTKHGETFSGSAAAWLVTVLCLAAISLAVISLAACGDPPTPTATLHPELAARQTEVAKLYLVETMVVSVTPAAFPVPLVNDQEER